MNKNRTQKVLNKIKYSFPLLFYLFSTIFIFHFILFFTPLIFIILKIFSTWTLVIFSSTIYLCFVSCHLNNFSLTYEILNLMANEVYSCHDIGLFRVAWTFYVSNLLMNDQSLFMVLWSMDKLPLYNQTWVIEHIDEALFMYILTCGSFCSILSPLLY